MNGWLHLSLCLVYFDGQCRYGDDDVDYLATAVSSTLRDCKEKCLNKDGCTAVAYGDTVEPTKCAMYKGGPYTYGTPYRGRKCYVMPGIHISCSICKINDF